MKAFRHLILALALVGAAGALISNAALAGEDWPFFCRLDTEGMQMFNVVDDVNSPTGHTLIMYLYGEYDGSMAADVRLSDDNKYYVIHGREHLGPFRDRQLLAFINRYTDEASHADVRMTRRNRDADFYLQPVACGAPTPGS